MQDQQWFQEFRPRGQTHTGRRLEHWNIIMMIPLITMIPTTIPTIIPTTIPTIIATIMMIPTTMIMMIGMF